MSVDKHCEQVENSLFYNYCSMRLNIRRRYTYENTAVTSSVSQNACHTPTAPAMLLRTSAAGMITSTYLQSDIISDGSPLPRPSSEPVAVTDTDDTINPIQSILSASPPFVTVSAFSVNIAVSCSENASDSTVPTAIIPHTIAIAV